LVNELRGNHEDSAPSPPEKENFTLLWEQNGYCCYRVNADPIFTPEEFEEFRRNRERREAEFKKMTPEEIKQRTEQRNEALQRAKETLAQIPDETIQESVEIWRTYGLCE
jgi:type IV secretory pathway VirB4 component